MTAAQRDDTRQLRRLAWDGGRDRGRQLRRLGAGVQVCTGLADAFTCRRIETRAREPQAAPARAGAAGSESKAMVQALRAACRHLLVHLAVDHVEAAIEIGDALVAAQEVLAVARRVVLVLADGHRAAHVVEVRARPTRGLVDNGVLGERRRGAGLVVKDDLSGETKVELAPWTIRVRVRVRVRVRARARAAHGYGFGRLGLGLG
eukprot:scaffold45515_cov67-Phaeocystis_antarctica.AAC.3